MIEPTETTMGKRIAALRKQANMTQEQLASLLGISPQAVSKWENDISCPDIAILPKLASIFHISTDELLSGTAPENREMAIEPEADGSACSGDCDTCSGSGCASSKGGWKHGGLFFPALLILLGIVFLIGRENGAFPGIWDIVWPAVVLGIGVTWIVRDWSPLGLGVAFIGFYHLLKNIGQPLPFALDWELIWPSALILLGLTILVDRFLKPRLYHIESAKQHGCGPARQEYNDADGSIHLVASFGETRRAPQSTLLRGGDIKVSFAGGLLDLTKITAVAPDAELRLDVSFAGYDLLLPRTIRVDNRTHASFGGLDIHGEPSANASVLILTGSISFGGVEVKYV